MKLNSEFAAFQRRINDPEKRPLFEGFDARCSQANNENMAALEDRGIIERLAGGIQRYTREPAPGSDPLLGLLANQLALAGSTAESLLEKAKERTSESWTNYEDANHNDLAAGGALRLGGLKLDKATASDTLHIAGRLSSLGSSEAKHPFLAELCSSAKRLAPAVYKLALKQGLGEVQRGDLDGLSTFAVAYRSLDRTTDRASGKPHKGQALGELVNALKKLDSGTVAERVGNLGYVNSELRDNLASALGAV